MDTPMVGPLPDAYVDILDWSKLHGFVEDALLRQPPHIRNELIELSRMQQLTVHPFDGDGFATVALCGARLLRLHWTRLLPVHSGGAS